LVSARASASAASRAGGLPAPLACLVRYYVGKGVDLGGRTFALELPDGERLPYRDGETRTFEQKLEHPDIADAFSQRYRAGPIRPVTTPDDDPGRIRVDALFTSTYGASEREVAKHIVKIDVLGRKLPFHERVAAVMRRVSAKLVRAVERDPALRPFLTNVGGSFVWRNIAGTDRPSAHSYGVSIDLNVQRSHYWRWQRPPSPIHWQNAIPQTIVDIFESEGFIWGGRWYHYDTMHFEYRPELLDSSCYENPGD
jgi:hypothetical protein